MSSCVVSRTVPVPDGFQSKSIGIVECKRVWLLVQGSLKVQADSVESERKTVKRLEEECKKHRAAVKDRELQ